MASNWQTSNKYQQYLVTMVALYRRRPDVKAYMELLLSLGTIGILGLFAIRPTALTITQLLTDINSKQETSDQMTKKIEDLNTAQSLMVSQKANIALLTQAIPTGAGPETYERQIEGIATKNGVALATTSIDPTLIKGEGDVAGAKPTNNTGVTTIPLPPEAKAMKLSFIVTGTYNQISSFLKDIEKTRRPIILDDVSLSSASGEVALTLTVTGRVTFQ